MAKYVTPAGVVIEMSESAARAVGYEPEKVEPKAEPKKRASSRKKAD